jgi:transcriptional regulator with PAS, ATPase and Fis domain
MQKVRKVIVQLGSVDSNVLITGETGTGKELVAQLIHRNSSRAAQRLVVVNCAAIPDNLLESELFGYERGAFTGAVNRQDGMLRLAHQGTVFLDEIGDMSLHAQAKILRVIETKEIQRLGGRANTTVDVRIVAATNQDLGRLMTEGRFRPDLFYRLSVTRVELPPLRQRIEDILLLTQHCVVQLNRQFDHFVEGLTPDALKHLMHYSWPGNVRELWHVLEAIFVARPPRWISCRELPPWFPRGGRHPGGCGADDYEQLFRVLRETNWNKSRAAERLHVSRMTLYRKLARYRLSTAGEQESIGGLPTSDSSCDREGSERGHPPE